MFDSLLFRPATDKDIDRYDEVQTVLREEIVNPLREKLFVRADRVMKLRTLMEKLSSVTGLTCEEKGEYCHFTARFFLVCRLKISNRTNSNPNSLNAVHT